MLTSKQRAQLRAIANGLDTIIQIGKSGVTDNIISQADEAMIARELIKGRVLENSLMTAKEACDELTARTGAEAVQVIGSRFVLFRQNKDTEKQKIKLEK